MLVERDRPDRADAGRAASLHFWRTVTGFSHSAANQLAGNPSFGDVQVGEPGQPETEDGGDGRRRGGRLRLDVLLVGRLLLSASERLDYTAEASSPSRPGQRRAPSWDSLPFGRLALRRRRRISGLCRACGLPESDALSRRATATMIPPGSQSPLVGTMIPKMRQAASATVMIAARQNLVVEVLIAGHDH